MKLKVQTAWKLLFIAAAFCTLWVGALLAWKAFHFYRMSEWAEGRTTNWRVVSLGEEKHYVCADYLFMFHNKPVSGRYLFSKTVYLSREGAEAAIEVMRSSTAVIWYHSSKEGVVAAVLERDFPTKELIRFGAALGIFLYFYGLRAYLYRFRVN